MALVASLGAELPPSAYEAMQREAPDVLRINVLTVTRADGPENDQEKVDILAEVLKVGRSASKLKVGDIITISYVRAIRQPDDWVGPGEVPVPEEKDETVAYLKPIEGAPDYAPAAGAMSFSTF